MAQSELSSFLCQFDPDFANIVVVSSDNRVKIWNIESHRLVAECVQPNHLDAQYTCVTWIELKTSKKRNKKEKEKINWNGLALGTQKGQIVVWDLTKAEIFKTWKAHNLKINDIVYAKLSNSVYSCSEDQTIIQWDVQTGNQQHAFKRDKTPVHKLCLNSNETLLGSSSSIIKVWDLSSKRVSKKFIGHASAVTSLKFSHDGSFMISATNDRFVSLWDCASDTESNQALQVFASDSKPNYLDLFLVPSTQLLYILAHTELGTVNLWQFSKQSQSSESNASKSMGVLGKISPGSDQTLISTTFISDHQILIVHGNLVKPRFTVLEFVDKNGQIIPSQTLEATQDTALLPKSEKKKKVKQQEVNILDPTSQPLPHVKAADEELAMTSDQTLEDKLDLMEVDEQEQEKGGISLQNLPKADSLQSILIQALRTNDNAMLESVLAVSDPLIIRNTVQRLPASQILPFLKAVIDRFQNKPTRSATLLVWIQTVLKQHTSYLITVPDLVKTLSGLYLVVDSRLSSFKSLMQLSGRLDLLLSQIAKNSAVPDDAEVEDLSGPQTVYEESSEEEN